MKITLFSKDEFDLEEARYLNKIFKSFDIKFHLRMPNSLEEDWRSFLNQIDAKFHSRIVLHGHFNLLKEFDVAGLHASEKNKSKLLDKGIYNKFISTVAHKENEAFRVSEKFSFLRYLFLAPIFQSVSQPEKSAGFTFEDLKNFVSKLTIPVIALGGVRLENVRSLTRLGFAGVGVKGAFWQNSNPSTFLSRLESELGR